MDSFHSLTLAVWVLNTVLINGKKHFYSFTRIKLKGAFKILKEQL